MRLSITWPASTNEQAIDVLRNVVGLRAFRVDNRSTDSAGDITIEVDLNDDEFDALEPYWCNPFVWSPA